MPSTAGSVCGSVSHVNDRLNQVEEIILGKVQQRTPQRMNEDTFIVKTFRYYDMSGTGICDFDTFKRALAPFTSGILEQDVQSIFQRYATQGALNYKVFAAEFVDGVRRQPELLPPIEDDETPSDCLMRMRDFLCSQGPRVIMGLATAFREADPQNSRCASYEVFQALMVEFFGDSCLVREEQADQIFDLLRHPYAPDQLAYDEFMYALQVEMCEERREAVRAAFRRLDTSSEGLVEMSHLVRSFNANRHPQVSDGSRQPEEVLEEFSAALKDAVEFRRGQRSYPNKLVAWEEFEDYYKMVHGCYADDAFFCMMVHRVWDVDKMPSKAVEARDVVARPAAGVPAKSRAGLHHWQADTLPSSLTHHKVSHIAKIDNVMDRVRQLVAKRGLRAAVGLVESFYNADDDMDDILDVYEFRRACKHSNLTFHDAEEACVFEACATGGGGKLQLPLFLQLLHGPLSSARRAAVQEAFEALGGDPRDEASTLSPAVLKESFAAEAHPQVARGELEARAVAAEFLDTFSLLAHVRGGCQNGMVAFSDFLAYYEVVSSVIDNDSYFDLLLHRVWSVPSAGDQGAGSNAAPGPPFHKRSSLPVSPMKDPRPPAHDGPSAYSRPGGYPPESQDSPNRLDTHRRFMRKEGGYGDEVQPPIPPTFSAITKSSIVFDETASGELGVVLGHLRESLAKRGIRGWRNLAQRFQQHDHKKNGTVMRLDWERLHRTLGLGLAPEDREALFKGFSSGRRDGAMDYRDCLRKLCVSLPEHRQILVERLFEALRGGGPDVSAGELCERFDARSSPPCVLGRADPVQEAQAFSEAVEFFDGGKGFDADRFMELFRIFSTLYMQEDEFRLMTTAAFGLSAGGIGHGGA